MLDNFRGIQPSPQTTVDPQRSGYAEVLSWLARGWVSLACVSSACAILAYGGSFLIPANFVATVTLFVDSRSLQPLANTSGPAQGGDNNYEVSSVESQAKIITSRSVLSRVVADENLTDDPAFMQAGGTSLGDWVRSLVGISPARAPTKEAHQLRALQELFERVTVRRPERTFIIDVSVRARTNDMAARLANAVAKAYLDEQAAAQAARARRANDALTSRLTELRERLRTSQERLQAFKDRHGLVGTRLQLSSEQQLTDANAQLSQARIDRIRSLAQFDNLSQAASGSNPDAEVPEALASPTVSDLRGRQAEARRQLTSILGQFGPNHPSVRDAKDQLASLNQSLQAELQRIRQAARLRYQRALAAETAAQALVDLLSAKAADTSGALAEATQLQQEVDINRNLLNTFLSRSREMDELAQIDASTARIVSTAEPPFDRAFPPRGIVFVVVGAALGFWIAAARIVLQRSLLLRAGRGPVASRQTPFGQATPAREAQSAADALASRASPAGG
jgi:uncharacterized protein involved in exopolysaccharide biosynthesis